MEYDGTMGGGMRSEAFPTIPSGVAPGETPVPRGIQVRRRLSTARRNAPALTGAAAAFLLFGLDDSAVLNAAVFGFSIILVSRLLNGFPYPLGLIPVSRFIMCLLPVMAGALTLGAFVVADENRLDVAPFLLSVAVGGLVAVGVEVIAQRMLASRPLRIAVLGAAAFVPGIRREIDAIGGNREIEVIGWMNLGGHFGSDGRSIQAETLGRVRAAITEHEIDLLVRGPGSGAFRSGRDTYDAIAAGCLDLPVRMIDGNQLYEQVFGHVPIGTIDSAWFLFLMHPSFQASSKASKRAVDLIVGAMAALVALPIVTIGALAIRLDDGGKVLYRQRRVGERGREFQILKLRTMLTGREEADARWSAADDERVTRVGRILRRLHVDELPQIINVLLGDMTLVGPRPEQPQITAHLERVFPHYSRRLLVKPGVTGWAQVRCGYAGSELGSAWKLSHDLFYLKHRSLLIDLLIMLETVVITARDSNRPMRAPERGFLVRADVEERWHSGLGNAGSPEPALDTTFAGSAV